MTAAPQHRRVETPLELPPLHPLRRLTAWRMCRDVFDRMSLKAEREGDEATLRDFGEQASVCTHWINWLERRGVA